MSKKSGCSGCPRLKVVSEDPSSRNFWNTCPLKKDSLPDTPCSLGKPEKTRKGRIVREPGCPWWIDSEKDNYCFWKYIQNNSEETGKMDSLLQNEIAQNFGCSSTKIHFVIKDALKKLKDSDKLGVLAEMADGELGSSEEPGSTSLDRFGLGDPESDSSDEP